MQHHTAGITPYGPIPSARQRAWHEREFYGFVHFTVNTFTDREWGYGDESPDVFNPTAFDAEQIVDTAKRGGMRGLILTAKHHDGFCLWPSRYSTHTVAQSRWRDGKGDVVGELARACATAGLPYGLYLSPWDRNHAAYGQPAYLTYYRNQLRELLTNYGPLFEVWFDGANGGDGFYGGANEQRKIDATTYYGWEETFQIVRDLQPDACIFSDAGPDVRWVGNEHGIAGDPCWATIDPTGLYPGLAEPAILNRGQRDGTAWLPAECDVSIRPGWFYHAHEDEKVRTPANLLDLYLASVGRGANLLVNLPVAPTGQVHPLDRAALLGFADAREQLYAHPLTPTQVRASTAHPQCPALDTQDDAQTCWVAAADDTMPTLTLSFASPQQLALIEVREYLPLGQRIDGWVLEVLQGTDWLGVAEGASIGNRRLVHVAATPASAVRLRVTGQSAPAAIRTMRVYGGAE